MLELPTELEVAAADAGRRLDRFLVAALPDFSRAHLQRAIEAGGIAVNDQPARASQKLHVGDRVRIERIESARPGPKPQAIPLDILFEDEAIAVVNKPAGMIVHPARGHWEGTLASAAAHHFAQLSGRGGATRPGIVHRLDRDTSGVIVIAKSDPIHDRLAEQFQTRAAEKEYLAIVVGVPERDSDVVDAPIADHPTQREKKAIRTGHSSSREAMTRWEIAQRFAAFALVRAYPKTGRTHQIRLHLAHAGHPVLCDRLYGGRSRVTAAELNPAAEDGQRVVLNRQALHSHRLRIAHPQTGESVQFEAPIPADMADALRVLRS